MPIYEYKCDLCGKEFEELVLGSSPKVNCPKC
ncbi:MAG: zinc ribbon domain-containing protein, partial [Deltaproteobacteria bacterium]